MRDAGDHASDFRAVRQRVRHADPPQPEGPHGPARLGLGSYGGLDLGDLEIGHAAHATSVGTWVPRCFSWYARRTPLGVTSSGDLPRSRAISSGRFRPFKPAMVAWATLMLLDEPSDLASTS